ncbi:PQQ-binding-like beta-propeller repeat protein [Nocardia asteroides]|uniref:outer membrane protein assembly factor BamB family protein n=1 Tax=Nocardia asteroides TaxID=1824 RepID=UPI0037C51799
MRGVGAAFVVLAGSAVAFQVVAVVLRWVGYLTVSARVDGEIGTEDYQWARRTLFPVELGLWLLSLLIMLVAWIVLTVWMVRARANADAFSPVAHQLSPPWAFWSWTVPVVSLWFPAVFVHDVAKASSRRRSGGMVVGWWVAWVSAWVVTWVGWLALRLPDDNDTIQTMRQTEVDMLFDFSLARTSSTVLFALAGTCLAVVILRVGREQDAWANGGSVPVPSMPLVTDEGQARTGGPRNRSELRQDAPPGGVARIPRPGRRVVLASGLAVAGVTVLGVGAATTQRLAVDGNDTQAPEQPESAKRIRWQAEVGNVLSHDVGPLMVSGGSVITADSRRLTKIEAGTGRTGWSTSMRERAGYNSAVLAGKTVVVDSYTLIGYEVATGSELWRSKAAWGLFGMCADDHSVYAPASGMRGVAALDARTGVPRWISPTGGSDGGPLPTAVGAGIVAAVDADALVVFDAVTGALRWRFDGLSSDCSPCIGGTDTVVVHGLSGHVRAFDIATAAPLWVVDDRSVRGEHVRADAGTVYIGGGQHNYGGGAKKSTTVVALDSRTGRKRWTAGATEAPPAVGAGVVVTVGKSGVQALDVATGSPTWSLDLGAPVSEAVVADGTAYVYGAGSVYAIRL